MPDITLYREDVETIRYHLEQQRIKREYELIQGNGPFEDGHTRELRRLDGLLFDRLVQQLHPARETREIYNES